MSDSEKKEEKAENNEKKVQKEDPHYQKYRDNSIDFDTNRGPIDDRGCTDIFFCIFFVLFIGGMAVVAGLGFSEGRPDLVFTPFDEDGRNCGTNLTANYPYLYLYKVVSNLKDLNATKVLSNAVCIKSCPQNYTGFLDCLPTTLNKLCEISEFDFYASMSFLGRYCIPSTEKAYNVKNGTVLINFSIKNQTESLFNANFINTDKLISWITDLQTCWPILLASVGFAFVVAFIYLLFVRYCAGVIAYTTILLVLAALAGLGYLFQSRIEYYQNLNDTQYELAMKVLCGLCYSLAGIWLLVILFMCERIRLAIALSEVTAEYVGKVCSVYFVPIIFYVVTILFYAYWVALSVFIYSSGTIVKSNVTLMASVEWNSTTRYSWWYHLFSLFYINAFLNALNQFVLASSACIWYFNQGKDGVDSKGEVSTSLHRAFRYHLGSLAFGSLIVAIIQFLIAILEYLKKKTEAAGEQKSKIYKCLISCCQCCLACIAKCVEFINRHAYIQIALTGHSFCRAAFDGFSLVFRNLGRWSMLFLIGGSFNFIGKLFIASGTGVTGYLLITRIAQFSEKLNSPILPTAVMVLVGWLVGSLIMNIYGMSGDAMLHSFILDEEKNNGVAKSSCPDKLRTFMRDERN